MKVMGKTVGESILVNLTILQNQGKVLNAKHHEVARDTESHLRQHRVDIGVPEDKPTPERLTDVYPEDAA
jgi:hypothetical protein